MHLNQAVSTIIRDMNIFTKYALYADEYYETSSLSEDIGDDDDELAKLAVLDSRLYIYSVVIILGLVLNAVVIVVYLKNLKKSTHVILFCLSVCDILNCLNISLEVLKTADVLPETCNRVVCIVYPYLADTGCLVSATLVMCLALDRYLRSKHLKNSLSRSQSFKLVTGVVVSSIVVTSPFLIVRTTTLTRFSEMDRGLLCRQSYPDNVQKIYADGADFSNPKFFMMGYNGVMLTLLLCALVVISVLYIKMSLKIRNNSFSRRLAILQMQKTSDDSKRSSQAGIGDISKRSSTAGIKFDDNSMKESKFLNKNCDKMNDVYIISEPRLTAADENGNKKHEHENITTNYLKNIVDLRRKSSFFSRRRPTHSRILTPRYYILIVSAIILFIFYFLHFVLHIINICQLNTINYARPNYFRQGLLECLGHSFTLCYILNPVIYSFFNRGFVRHFKKLLCYDNVQPYTRRLRTSIDSSCL